MTADNRLGSGEREEVVVQTVELDREFRLQGVNLWGGEVEVPFEIEGIGRGRVVISPETEPDCYVDGFIQTPLGPVDVPGVLAGDRIEVRQGALVRDYPISFVIDLVVPEDRIASDLAFLHCQLIVGGEKYRSNVAEDVDPEQTAGEHGIRPGEIGRKLIDWVAEETDTSHYLLFNRDVSIFEQMTFKITSEEPPVHIFGRDG